MDEAAAGRGRPRAGAAEEAGGGAWREGAAGGGVAAGGVEEADGSERRGRGRGGDERQRGTAASNGGTKNSGSTSPVFALLARSRSVREEEERALYGEGSSVPGRGIARDQ